MSQYTPTPSRNDAPPAGSRVGPPLWMRLLSGPAGGPGGAAVDIGLLILRVGIGLMMAVGHGLVKLQNYETMSSKFPDLLGIGAANNLNLAIGAELVCALLVVIGLFTRLASLPLIATMATAAFVVHAKDPLFMAGGAAKEPALLYLVPFLALLFTGPGRFSVDGLMQMSARKEP